MKKSQLRLKQTMLFKMGIRFMGLQMLFIGRLRIVNTKPNDLRDALYPGQILKLTETIWNQAGEASADSYYLRL